MTETPKATFVDTVSSHLAESLSKKFKALVHSSEAVSVLEDVFRFVHGAESNRNGQPWEDRTKQEALRKALDALLKPSDLKRRREAEDTSTGAQSAKRPKLGGDIEDDGAPQYILHAVSATSPVRRKVDLVVTASSLKLLNTSSQATEAAISLSDLKRAFVLPTRGKTKAHWTVVILSADTQDKTAPSPQVIFGLDASVSAPFSVTIAGSEKTAVKKGDATLPYIHAFLSQIALPNPVYETDTAVFKSASSKEPVAGTEAYLGAKVGSLWFLKAGILWGESKPCEFWPADSLLDIRVVSATGRQCSATIVRRVEGYEDGEGEETQFTFIDGREQDGISQWVRKYRKMPTGAAPPPPPPSLPAGPVTINSLAAESDDEDDDFDDKDESEEENSDTSDEEEGSNNGAEAEADASGEDEDDDDEEEELRPENHPLMRPGAMPRMSRAAMDMVVDMVEGDLMGPGDEVDELDD
ncbi:hypothetical protein BDZ89DRAFT_1077571 [Hymenopellis radicata]|nr:hypothetical protein BDZ89DRAFT_1077571 [Hymenopellis radicata]